MTILKDKMNEFPHLKLILMSATIQEEVFRTYFNDCPTLYVSGRCFPVTTHYLHDIEERIHGRRLAKVPPNHKTNPLNNPKGIFHFFLRYISLKLSNYGYLDEIIAPPKLDFDLLVQLICHIIATSSNTKVIKPRFKDRGETILVFLSGINAIENVNKLLRTKDIIKQNDSKVNSFYIKYCYLFKFILLYIIIIIIYRFLYCIVLYHHMSKSKFLNHQNLVNGRLFSVQI